MWLGIMALIAGTVALGSSLNHSRHIQNAEHELEKLEDIKPLEFASENDKFQYGIVQIHVRQAKQFESSRVRIKDCLRMMEEPLVCWRLLESNGLKYKDFAPKTNNDAK